MTFPCMFDGHVHRWDGPPVTVRAEDCATCEGSGRDPDADPALDDLRFPHCYDCGGEGGEDIEVDSTCSICGVRMSDFHAATLSP